MTRRRIALTTSARVSLSALIVGGVGLTAVIAPAPWQLWHRLAHAAPAHLVDAAAALVGASLVWAVAGWLAALSIGMVVAQLPGVAGRFGIRALRIITPPLLRGMFTAATGITLIVGISACSTSAPASTPSAPTAPALTWTGDSFDDSAASWGTEVAGYDDSSNEAESDASSSDDVPVEATSETSGAPVTVDVDWLTTPIPAQHSPALESPSTGPVVALSPETPQAPATAISVQGVPADVGTDSSTDPRLDTNPDADGEAASAGTDDHSADPAASAADADATAIDPANSQPLRDEQISSGPVTVRPGDTLWSIAAASLGADASTADIDSAWRAWYAANRATIGMNPDLIFPGQRLAAPAA